MDPRDRERALRPAPRTSMAEMQAFYDAAFARLHDAMAYLRPVPARRPPGRRQAAAAPDALARRDLLPDRTVAAGTCPRQRRQHRLPAPSNRRSDGIGAAPDGRGRALMETDVFRRELVAWLDEHVDELRPRYERARHARPADGAVLPRQANAVRRRVGPLRMAGGRRRARRAADAARRRRRGGRGARPRRGGHVVDDRGPRSDRHPVRTAGADGGDGAAAPARRRDVVPGFLRAGRRQRPRLAHVPCHACRRRLGRQRAEGLDQLRPVRHAVRAAHTYG